VGRRGGKSRIAAALGVFFALFVPAKLAPRREGPRPRAFWRNETSAQPDTETYTAVLPSLLTTKGMLNGISTGYRRAGLLHAKPREHYGENDDDVLFVQGSSTTFNRTLSEAAVAKLRAADPGSADAEWDATFTRSDVAAFLPDDVIEDAIDYDRPLELPPQSNVSFRAFVDPSGGVGRDSYFPAQN
jgi:hypothetical protein